jgi:hypothetical protein
LKFKQGEQEWFSGYHFGLMRTSKMDPFIQKVSSLPAFLFKQEKLTRMNKPKFTFIGKR